MKKNAGFTIIELLTVIAIIAIISAITIPNMIAWRTNQQLNSMAREVLSMINGARIAAIKNNATVTITFDAAGKKVTTSYINRATGVAPPPNITLLRPQVEIGSTTFASDAFRFNSRGLPINIANNNFASGTVTLNTPNGKSLEVVVASTGVTRINKP